MKLTSTLRLVDTTNKAKLPACFLQTMPILSIFRLKHTAKTNSALITKTWQFILANQADTYYSLKMQSSQIKQLTKSLQLIQNPILPSLLESPVRQASPRIRKAIQAYEKPR